MIQAELAAAAAPHRLRSRLGQAEDIPIYFTSRGSRWFGADPQLQANLASFLGDSAYGPSA
jgi:hypothetical protein